MTEPVLDLLDRCWSSVSDLLTDLGDEDWDRPTDLPGWTVRDNVAHMIGTERMLAGDATPEAPAAFGDHVRNPIGEVNEAWVDHYRSQSGADVHAAFDEVTGRRLAELRALPAERWDQVGFTPEGEAPYRRFMEIRVFDCWEHEQDIRRAVGRPGHLDGPVAAHSITQVTNALGYMIGKKARVPDDTTVVFDIDGSLPMILPVYVDGRARVLDREPSSRDVTIFCDTETYNALGCGRWSGREALAEGRVRLDGDEELGRLVLDHMGFVL